MTGVMEGVVTELGEMRQDMRDMRADMQDMRADMLDMQTNTRAEMRDMETRLQGQIDSKFRTLLLVMVGLWGTTIVSIIGVLLTIVLQAD